jgi:hypothetical protein
VNKCGAIDLQNEAKINPNERCASLLPSSVGFQ